MVLKRRDLNASLGLEGSLLNHKITIRNALSEREHFTTQGPQSQPLFGPFFLKHLVLTNTSILEMLHDVQPEGPSEIISEEGLEFNPGIENRSGFFSTLFLIFFSSALDFLAPRVKRFWWQTDFLPLLVLTRAQHR